MMLRFQIVFIILLSSFRTATHLNAQHWVEVDPSIGRVSDIDEFEQNLYSISNVGVFSYSTDNGNTWATRDIYDSATLTNRTFTAITFFDANHGIIGIRNHLLGNQLLETLNGGEYWEVIETEYDVDCPNTFIPIDLHWIGDSTAILGLLQSGTYYITTNRGLNWSCDTPFTAPDWLQAKTIRSETEWLFNSRDGLYKTNNAGDNWNLIFSKNFAHYQEGDNNEIYGLTWYYDEPSQIPVMYTSTDDFQSFDSISLNQFKGEYIDLFVMVSENKLYIRAKGEEIYYSDDGGQSFQLVQVLTNEPLKTSKINGSWYMFGRGLWKLEDNAVNTTEIFSSEINLVYPNPTSQFIHIKNHDYHPFELIDISGKTVQSGQIENNQIDISTQKSGMFFLRLKTEDGYLFKKIIKL